MRDGVLVTPPVLERYELKFVIPDTMIGPISDFVSIYCSLDKYSRVADDSFYRVINLYLDTPYFLFLRNRLLRLQNRFNMRIRSYGDTPQARYFLEVKQKNVMIIKKYRGSIPQEDLVGRSDLIDYIPQSAKSEKELQNIELFQRLMHTYDAGPKVQTQYLRKAYVSDCEEYARVTFDIALKYMAEETFNLTPDPDRMLSYDISTNFDPACNVILELKCYTSQVPLWMVDCIRTFGLNRRSFSKYATGVSEVLNCYHYDTSSREPVSSF